jgi:hypothetical protein
MVVFRKNAALLVVFFFILIAPASAFGKDTKSSGDDGTFLSLYQEQYQNAFSILIPKGWKAEGGMVPSGVGWVEGRNPTYRRLVSTQPPSPASNLF